MRNEAIKIYQAAVKAVRPAVLLPDYISVTEDTLRLGDQLFSLSSLRNIYVIGAGKASAAMAAVVEEIAGDYITAGIVVTKYGHARPLKKVLCREAAHPVPDENGVRAATELMDIVSQAGKDDVIITLISGGASALLADCPPGIPLKDVQLTFQLLLQCGADIGEMNTVRKHVSLIKGGQLARQAYPANLVSFILSDVIGDLPEIIASGPTVPDPSTFRDAYAILEKYGLNKQVPAAVADWLKRGIDGEIPDTPKPNDPAFAGIFNYVIGTNKQALQAARHQAESSGYYTSILTNHLNGEAREAAATFVKHVLTYAGPLPACLLAGGETTVTLMGKGKGGRNQEFVLAALQAIQEQSLSGRNMPVILSAGTDGTDGPTDAAGAFIDSSVLVNVKQLSLLPQAYLDNNDAYHFFKQVNGLLITGPTQTNVMDIVVALIF